MGDYEVTLAELRTSILVQGPRDRIKYPSWEASWRLWLVDHLEMMVNQLWSVGVSEIYIDGSFVEDKDHPNDIDGYFVCDVVEIASGRLVRALNGLAPQKVWTWDPALRRAYPGYPKNNFQCGMFIASSYTRISLDLVPGFGTSSEKSWNSQLHSDSAAATQRPKELSN